ncbi:MAG: polysaccharide biosynthesis C-terminal domain-containing protein [Anaerolineae bacterium]|nr:polysaccharide biosynthesis C-terminal domain-containing protein [Anaerolineae bacterium]
MVELVRLLQAKAAGVIEGLAVDLRRLWRAGAVHIGVSTWLTRLVQIAQRILLARILGAEGIGHVAVVTSALNVIRLPAGVGTFTVVNKLVAEGTGDPLAQRRVVGTSLWVNAGTTLAVGGAAWGVLSRTSWVNDPVANRLLRVLIPLLPLMIFSEVLRNALMGQRRMRAAAGVDIALAVIGILVVLPMAYLWGLSGWLLNQMLIVVAGFAGYVWLLRPLLGLDWSRAVALKVGSIGSFAFLGQLTGTLLLQFDTLSVSGILRDAAATGVYNSAALVAQQMMAVPGAVLTVVFPFVAQNKGDLPRLRQRYWELFRKIGMLSAGMSAIAWVACPWFFPLLGREFVASVPPFRVLLAGFVARSLYVLDNTYLDALGRTDLTFASGLLAAVATVALNLLFIPRWGLMGAAWATAIAMSISFAIRQLALHHFTFGRQAVR